MMSVTLHVHMTPVSLQTGDRTHVSAIRGFSCHVFNQIIVYVCTVCVGMAALVCVRAMDCEAPGTEYFMSICSAARNLSLNSSSLGSAYSVPGEKFA